MEFKIDSVNTFDKNLILFHDKGPGEIRGIRDMPKHNKCNL